MRYAYGLHSYCSLCQHEGRDDIVSDVTTHILGGCPSEQLRRIHCMRHDKAVDNRVYDSITRGNKGAIMVLRDTGKYHSMDDNRKHTLPQYLHR